MKLIIRSSRTGSYSWSLADDPVFVRLLRGSAPVFASVQKPGATFSLRPHRDSWVFEQLDEQFRGLLAGVKVDLIKLPVREQLRVDEWTIWIEDDDDDVLQKQSEVTRKLPERCQLWFVEVPGQLPRQFPWDGSLMIVGRGKDFLYEPGQLKIPDERISRRHCSMERRDNAIWVEDLGSQNGIRINGARLKAGSMEPNGVLQLGRAVIRQPKLEAPPPRIGRVHFVVNVILAILIVVLVIFTFVRE